ncbi:MAG TPA: sigma-70 family RNA polymerase sigma factor [Chloroflexota bacterium]|nr:sigma-70 family RNA polymerase sigma factor [Chloroflexota bacterium]
MYARVEPVDVLENLGDSDLVRLYRQGRDDALDELLHRHRDALYRFCCHLMHDREDAEDICQETLARAMVRVGSLQSGAAFRSWLFSIARNLSIDSFRSRRRLCPMPDEEVLPLPLYGDTPQEKIEVREEHQTVVEALGKLAASHQRVLVLREVDGLSYADIASEMNVSQSAVETLLFRARRRLREEYHKVGAPAVTILGGLRDLVARLAPPALPPATVKAAVTAAALSGVIATIPRSGRNAAMLPLPVERRPSYPAIHSTRHVDTHTAAVLPAPSAILSRPLIGSRPTSGFMPRATTPTMSRPPSAPVSTVSRPAISATSSHRSGAAPSRTASAPTRSTLAVTSSRPTEPVRTPLTKTQIAMTATAVPPATTSSTTDVQLKSAATASPSPAPAVSAPSAPIVTESVQAGSGTVRPAQFGTPAATVPVATSTTVARVTNNAAVPPVQSTSPASIPSSTSAPLVTMTPTESKR